MRTLLLFLTTFLGINLYGSEQTVLSATAGGSGKDYGEGIALDSNGNSVVTGYFQGSALFDSVKASSGAYDGFLAKYGKNGTLIWFQQFIGSGNANPADVALDSEDNCYVTGHFEGELQIGNLTTTAPTGSHQVFLTKIDRNGTPLWLKTLAGSGSSLAYSVAVTPVGEAAITGYFSGQIIAGTNVFTASGDDILIASFDRHGSLKWVQTAGSDAHDFGYDVAIAGSDELYVTGFFTGTATFGNQTLVSKGGGNNWPQAGDAFVSKYSEAGELLWVKQIGGPRDDAGKAIKVGPDGSIVIGGNFEGQITLDGTQIQGQDRGNIFVIKTDTNGVVQWVRTSEAELLWDVAVSEAGEIYPVGQFTGTATFGTNAVTANDWDLYIASYSSEGEAAWVKTYGGSSGEAVYAVDARQQIVATGVFTSGNTRFPDSTEATAGAEDIFILSVYEDSELTGTGGFNAPGLVGYFPFSGDANDLSTNGNDLNIVNAVLTEDRFGHSKSAYHFNGTDAFLLGSDESLPLNNSPRTVTFWMRPDSFRNVSPVMFSYGEIETLNTFYAILFDSRPGQPIALGKSGGGDAPSWTGATLSNWLHVTVSFDGNQGHLFIDGSKVGSSPRSYSTTPTGKLYIGAYVNALGHFHGALDDFRFYDRALTELEVSQLHEVESHPPSPRRATAIAQVVNGFVVGITVTDPGFGYNEAPKVRFRDSQGTNAVATAVILDGQVVAVNIDNPGRNYTGQIEVLIGSPTFPAEMSIVVSKVRVTVRLNLGFIYRLESSHDLNAWNFVSEFEPDQELWSQEFDVQDTGRYFRVFRLP